MKIEQVAVSPCSNPEMGLDDVLSAYASLGYKHFEVFTSWTNSAFDYHTYPQAYLKKGQQYSMVFTSFHLPSITADCLTDSLQEAITAARFAEAMGVEIVLYKAHDRATYINAAPAFLNAIEDLRVIPVIQNHYGSALSTLDDMKSVFEGIGDPRMRTLLEVGHFHSVGVDWRKAAEYLGDSVALVHIKDQIGQQSVPFGQGEIDLHALFQTMDENGFEGRYVIEMEVRDKENTLAYLADAHKYVLDYCEEGT